jgi:cyclopropane-fatty-acyl-phospholipid synthase
MSARDVFFQVLDTCITDAKLRFIDELGPIDVGRGDRAPSAIVQINDPSVYARTLILGNLGLGESYMDGNFVVLQGGLYELLTVMLRNRVNEQLRYHPRLVASVGLIRLRNVLRGSADNVRAHYDIGDDLFESFLDSTLTYSCGYARSSDEPLESLQHNKRERICQKLQLREGDHLLDVGCGYGGLLIHAAKHFGVSGVGITLSRRHYAVARERIEREQLDKVISIRLQDHRVAWRAQFDKIVSVGMMEHLPRSQYATYVRHIAQAMKPDGRGLIHAIGCNSDRNEHDPFTQKRIFPGSAQPKLSEIAANLENHGLAILDVENIVRHYAVTCARWLERFNENRDTLDPARFDERTKRMWEYYLCCGIAAARAAKSAVYQVLFTNNHAASLPFQRV